MTWTVDPSEPKPHVHPLTTPRGRVVTEADNPDHPWQRGLWFVVKFVDGVNFWEEFGDHGIQRVAPDGTIEWVGPDGDVVIRERRSVTEVSDPLGDDVAALDWTSTLTATRDVLLDRTPYQGWGGYGGLALRGPADWTDTRIRLPDDPPEGRDAVIGESAPWCDVSGPDRGVTLLDHPSNPRFPTPWYGNVRNPIYGDDLWTNFVNAAFLFHEPMPLAADAPCEFRYRVIAHDGPADDARCSQWSAAFRAD